MGDFIIPLTQPHIAGITTPVNLQPGVPILEQVFGHLVRMAPGTVLGKFSISSFIQTSAALEGWNQEMILLHRSLGAPVPPDAFSTFPLWEPHTWVFSEVHLQQDHYDPDHYMIYLQSS